MSKCRHKGCNVTMPRGDFCPKHEPVRCPLCDAPLLLMSEIMQSKFASCLIGKDAEEALKILLKKGDD
jgi:hypothetical protein